jgi:hypothetical protein
MATTDEDRWQAHWIDDRPEEKLVFYCSDCAEPESDVGKDVEAGAVLDLEPLGVGA